MKKTVYFARKTCLLLLSARKTIKFTISHSFIIFYLFNWTYSLEDSISIAVAEKKNSILFSFMLLSLFLHLYACHSLSFSLFMLAPEFREKGKINDVAVTFNDLLRIILLPCLFLSTCCWLFILLTPQLKTQIYFSYLCFDYCNVILFYFRIFLWGFDFLVENNGRFMKGNVVSNDFLLLITIH